MEGIGRYPLPLFFIAAYTLSWVPWGIDIALAGTAQPLITLGAFGPMLAALLVTGVRQGRVGVRDRIGGWRRWRLSWRIYALALIGPALLALGAALLEFAAGGLAPGVARQVPSGYPIYLIIPILIPIFLYGLIFGGPLGEEPGWRGFALPILLTNFSPPIASTILGIIWGCWHIPLFFIPGTTQTALPLYGFVLWTIGLAYLFTRLHMISGGNTVLAIVFHAAINLSTALLILPTPAFPSPRPFFLHLGLVWLVCVILAATASFSERTSR